MTDTHIVVEIARTTVVEVVEPGPQGIPGPQGVPGPAGVPVSYIHAQGSPALQWVINHNLGFRPHCTVYSVGGAEVEADVIHTSQNQAVITFVAPTAGTARFV